MLAVGPGMRTGMPIRIDNPRELGADRLVNAVAAHHELGGPCISVDFGTAVNYDCVSADGEYLGGVIAPGVEISHRRADLARGEAAADRPRARRARRSARAPSRRSAPAIVFGFAAQVDGLVARIREELGGAAATIATGGLAGHIVPFTTSIDRVDDLLTLKGLKLLHERSATL